MPFATRAGRPSCRPGCARTLVDPLSRTWVASATAGGPSEPPGRPIARSGRPRGWGPLHAYATGALPRSPPAWGLTARGRRPPARTATRPRKPGTRCSGTRGTLDPHRGCRAIRSVTGTGGRGGVGGWVVVASAASEMIGRMPGCRLGVRRLEVTSPALIERTVRRTLRPMASGHRARPLGLSSVTSGG